MNYDYKENRQIRIFISSTFRDMMQERDYLITRIFPQLRRYCEERDISLFELDLRWGVTQEESENQMAFKICLNEVDNTNPFFIGLLGERYGWVPDEKTQKQMEPTKVFEEYEWLLDELKKQKSITETEIHQGALRVEDEINAYFYIRSPKMKTPDEFREAKGSSGEKMLLELKERIRNDKRFTTSDYDSIQQLGEQVYKDFKVLVDRLFPGQGHLSDFEKERLQQHIYLKSKARIYVENINNSSFLDNFVKNNESAAVITGESGTGKSAFLANWIVNRKNKQIPNEKIIFHFTGVSQSQGDYIKISRRLTEEIRDHYDFKNDEDQSLSLKAPSSAAENEDLNSDIYNEFRHMLYAIPENEKLIIILDGIDRLNDSDNSKMLNWIPPAPPNVKFIFSALLNDSSMEPLRRRTKVSVFLSSLTLETRKKIIIKYFEKFSKKLSPKQLERVVSDDKSGNPFILLSILDNLRIFGNFDIFDSQIEERLSQKSDEALFDLFLQNIESVFKDDSKRSISKDNNPVKDIFSYIAVSHMGLTETEIVNISKIPKLYWSQLLNCMSANFISINGYITFSSAIMLNAVKNRYLKDRKTQKNYRKNICDYLESGTTLRRISEELLFQLFELKEWDKLYKYISYIDVFCLIYEKDKYELGNYWRTLHKISSSGYTMEKLLDASSLADKNISLKSFYHTVCLFILDFFQDYKLALAFALKIEEINKKSGAEDFDSPGLLGSCYSGMRDYKKALEYFIKCNDIYKKHHGDEHINQINIYHNIGDCFRNLGNFKEALVNHIIAHELREKHFNGENSETADSLNNIGMCYEGLGEYQKAHDYYNNALSINEKYYGKAHINTSQSLFLLGMFFKFTGQYHDAIMFFNRAAEIKIKYYGHEHKDVVLIIEHLGSCFESLGDYDQALKCYNNNLNINLKNHERKNELTAVSYSNIGSCYFSQEIFEKAFEYYKESLVIRTELFGKDHPVTALSYNNIANCFYSTGQYQRSLEYHNKAVSAWENACGKEYKDLAMSHNNIGACYQAMGDYEKSLESFKKSLSIYEKTLTNNHPEIGQTLGSIGVCYDSLKEYGKSLEYYIKALSIYENAFGNIHPNVAMINYKIAACYSFLRDYKNALEYFKKALVVYESLEGYGDRAENIRKNIEFLSEEVK